MRFSAVASNGWMQAGRLELTGTMRHLVLVSGDLVTEQRTYEGTRSVARDRSGRATRVQTEPGGCHRIAQLIGAITDANRGEQPGPSDIDVAIGCDGEPATAFSSWAPFASMLGKDPVWRASHRQGYGDPSDSTLRPRKTGRVPRVLVLDDCGIAIRHATNERAWHLGGKRPPGWIILRLGGPASANDLLDRLTSRGPLASRLVIVTSAQRLRDQGVPLSRGLSWERSAEELMDAVRRNAIGQRLGRARHLVVAFGGDGAVWVRSERGKVDASLVFDPSSAEGEWIERRPGDTFGGLSCVVASLAWHATSATPEGADLLPAITRGLSAMRNLHELGHGPAVDSPPDAAAFPAPRLAREILHPSTRYASATVPPGTAAAPWSILRSLQGDGVSGRPLHGFARRMAVDGDSVLEHVPCLRVAGLLTADRTEIESLRGLRRLMTAYRDTSAGKKPLSLGVFGAPGAGKSFGVEQLALGVFGDAGARKYDGWLEFNLSQFERTDDLVGALHQVRDRRLQGLVPVAFWDEFDAQEFRWLRSLLAPMQDGRFQVGTATHTIGKCVFIFAGGTSPTFEAFGRFSGSTRQAAERQFVLAKGPDFKSRLDGYLNVLGPNAQGDDDVFYPVRRALMLRNMLGCRAGEELAIDPGLLTALLEVSSYTHGARSLGKVLEPLARRAPSARIDQWLLPAPEQLALHVKDVDEFRALLQRDLAFQSGEVVARLAPAIHDTWRQLARAEGRASRFDVPFDALPPVQARSNDAAARRIADVLALIGLRIAPGTGPAALDRKVRAHIGSHVERLAEEEHRGWMRHLRSEGWTFGVPRNDSARVHDCLRPFHELAESEKEKDRNTVRHFPDFVRAAGFHIAFR